MNIETLRNNTVEDQRFMEGSNFPESHGLAIGRPGI